MKKYLFLFLVALLNGHFSVNSQTSPKDKGLQSITADAVRGQLEFLSSDWMEGRATGEKGSFLAADYVASMFRVFGVAPSGDPAMPAGSRMFRLMLTGGQGPSSAQKSYFQNFTLIETRPGGSSSLSFRKGSNEYIFEQGIDFNISRVSNEIGINSPVVFVGYGIQDKDKGIDDFAGVDVKGKVVVRLSGFPGYNDPASPMYRKLAGDNVRALAEITRKKNEVLNNVGALGVIDLTIDNDVAKRWGVYMFDNNPAYAESGPRTNWNQMRLDGKEFRQDPVTISVTSRVSDMIIKECGLDIGKFEREAAAGTLKFKPFQVQGMNVSLSVSLNQRRVNVRNVIAIIEGENPSEYVAVGAHMDHMGMDNSKIWNGADDNASGTVAVMTIARAFAESGVKPKRSIVFCAWTGEEKGLLGSEYFTMYPPAGKISDYKFYMNFDMIARDIQSDTARNMAGITYTKAYPKLEEITKTNVEKYKLNLKLNIRSQENPTGGSDYTAFTNNKIPVIAWMAAMHPDYHQPSDEVSLVNWNKMVSIIKLGYLQLWEAANADIK